MIVVAKSSTVTQLLLLLFSCRAEPEGTAGLHYSVWLLYSLQNTLQLIHSLS
jgi:hypothetical protein